MSDITPALVAFRTARQEEWERQQATRDLNEVHARLGAAQQALQSAEAAQRAEDKDVKRLESASFKQAWALVTGRHEEALKKETAEAEAAALVVADVRARVGEEQAAFNEVQQRLAQLQGADARFQSAMSERIAEIHADAHQSDLAAKLSDVNSRIAEADGEQTQLAEADHAARVAADGLAEAAVLLAKAADWSSYDTFFGGGMFGDMMKHDRMAEASNKIKAANGALRVLSRELADVGMGATEELNIGEFAGIVDMFFDNIFTDWAVRDRVLNAQKRVDGIRIGVARILSVLATRQSDNHTTRGLLYNERVRLLDPAG